MAGYKNLNNPKIQSVASAQASILQAELTGFGVTLGREEFHYLSELVAKYGADSIKAVAIKAVDKYTAGDNTAVNGFTVTEYLMDRLKRHNWNRNNYK